MHRRVLDMIRRETRHAREGRPARIIAKMNALVEEGVIRALYAASSAGVKIDLIVRGACALRPGVPGISDHIRVRSILGRFLEHHRVWYFENDGSPDVWLASADWMGRNLFRRVEVAFPVLDPVLRKRVVDEGLKAYLADNCEAWQLDANGCWSRVKPRRGARLSLSPGRFPPEAVPGLLTAAVRRSSCGRNLTCSLNRANVTKPHQLQTDRTARCALATHVASTHSPKG